MRVLAATTAGAGHFAPLAPLAVALRDAGHEVVVAAPASFRAAVEARGLTHAAVGDADPADLGPVFARLPQLSVEEANGVVVAEVFGGHGARAALPGMRDVVERLRPDVVLRDPAEVASYVVAEERGVPHVQVSIGLGSLDDVVVPLLEDPVRALGAEAGGLAAAPRWTCVPPSFDVPAQRAPADPWRYALPAGGAGRPLPDWWGGLDDPLVYVTLGSVAAGIGHFPQTYRAVLDAVADLPVRVLMTLGEAGDPDALGPLPDRVRVERWWSQADVLRTAAAVVCHGGFGTTLPALAAGVPVVVLPLFASDQYLTAARVAQTGTGEAVGSAAEVRDAVQRVLGSAERAAAARAVAEEVAALPPAAACVSRIERVAARA